MSEIVVLMQSGSVLNSMIHVATEGHVAAKGQVSLVVEGHAAVRAMQIWMPCAATQFHGVVQVRASAEGHAWFCGPTVARVSVDV